MQDELRHEAKLESARMAQGVEFDGLDGGEAEARSEHQAFAKPRSGRRDAETAEVETKRPERAALSEVDGRKKSKRKEREEGSTRRSKSRSRHKTKKEPDAESSNNFDRGSQDQKEKRRATTRTRESQAPPSMMHDSIFSKERPSGIDADKAKLLMAKYLRKQLKKSGGKR